MRFFFYCLFSLIILGCAKEPAAQPIPLDQVPPELMKISKEKLPEVTFDQSIKRADGSYEVRGRDKNGKVRDIDLTSSGEIIEIE